VARAATLPFERRWVALQLLGRSSVEGVGSCVWNASRRSQVHCVTTAGGRGPTTRIGAHNVIDSRKYAALEAKWLRLQQEPRNAVRVRRGNALYRRAKQAAAVVPLPRGPGAVSCDLLGGGLQELVERGVGGQENPFRRAASLLTAVNLDTFTECLLYLLNSGKVCGQTWGLCVCSDR